MERRTRPDWSNLPEDLLAIIAKRLFFHSLGDLFRFRAVCHSFQSSSFIFYPPETLTLNSSFRIYFSMDSTPANGSNFILSKSTIYAIHPLHNISNTQETTSTWLVRIEESNAGKVRISDPLGRCHFENVSSKLPKSLHLLDYRVKEITTAYRLELATLGKRSRVHRKDIHKSAPKVFRKVIASDCVDAFAVMAIHSSTGKLVVWRHGDEKWTNLDTSIESFRDIICYDEKFYAFGDTGTVAVDYKSLSFTQVAKPLQTMDFESPYLVKAFRDLFLITRFGASFKVYKLDKEKHEWVIQVMDELEDRLWFADNDCSFSLSAKELSGCEGNCVFVIYNYDLGLRYEYGYPGMYMTACALEIEPLSPLLSKTFWPPPSWIKQHTRSTPRFHRRRPGP